MSLPKRVERYFSAFFKLGRTARLAKQADHGVSVIEPRVDGLTQDFFDLGTRLAPLEGLPDHLREAEARLAGIDAEISEARGGLGDLATRLEGQSAALTGDLSDLNEAFTDIVERSDRAEIRLDTAEGVLSEQGPKIAQAEARLDAAEAGIAEQGPKIAQAEARLDAAEAGIAEQGPKIGAMETRLDAAEAGLSEHGPKIGAMETRLDGAFRRIVDTNEALRRERDALLARVEGLEAAIQSIQAGIVETQGAVRELQGAHEDAATDAHTRLSAIEGDLGQRVLPFVERADRGLERVTGDIAQTGRAYADLSRRLDLQRFRSGEARVDEAPGALPRREGLEAMLDAFYGRLEDRYRGSREEIKRRLAAAYLADMAAAAEAAPGKPMLDLGCGRGEWVELLGEQGHTATGVDLNPVQIDEAREMGLDVREGDAMALLAEAEDNAYAAITAHHLIEHIPFETLTWMTREALRVLAPGGLLIYETPNCRNLIVGATTFHIDPTHKRPLPAETLTTLIDTVGFHPVEARHLHPTDTLEAFLRAERLDPHIAELLFGSQDLAIVARKPEIA